MAMAEGLFRAPHKGVVDVPARGRVEVKRVKLSGSDVPCLIRVKLEGEFSSLNLLLEAEGASRAFKYYEGVYSLIVKKPGEYSLVLSNEKSYDQREIWYEIHGSRLYRVKGLIRVYKVKEFSPRTLLVTDGRRFMVLKRISHIQDVLEAERYSGISAWLAVRHEQVPRLLHANFERMYTLSEYVEGKPLSKIIERYRRERVNRDPVEIARIIRELLNPLMYASKLGIIHRDVKPANVIVSPRGRVYLIDWELACWLKDCHRPVGQYPYAPPEAGEGEYDERSDVYSLGVIIAEALRALGEQLPGGTELGGIAEDKARELKKLSEDMRAKEPQARPGLEEVSRRLEDIIGR